MWVKATISFLIVAGETPKLYFFSKASLPTGSAVSMYSSIIAFKIWVCLAVNPSLIASTRVTRVLTAVKPPYCVKTSWTLPNRIRGWGKGVFNDEIS